MSPPVSYSWKMSFSANWKIKKQLFSIWINRTMPMLLLYSSAWWQTTDKEMKLMMIALYKSHTSDSNWNSTFPLSTCNNNNNYDYFYYFYVNNVFFSSISFVFLSANSQTKRALFLLFAWIRSTIIIFILGLFVFGWE